MWSYVTQYICLFSLKTHIDVTAVKFSMYYSMGQIIIFVKNLFFHLLLFSFLLWTVFFRFWLWTCDDLELQYTCIHIKMHMKKNSIKCAGVEFYSLDLPGRIIVSLPFHFSVFVFHEIISLPMQRKLKSCRYFIYVYNILNRVHFIHKIAEWS